MKNRFMALTLAICALFIITFESCKKKRTDVGQNLYNLSHNKAFNKVTPEGFSTALQQALTEQKSKLSNPSLISGYYAQNEYDPSLVLDHLKDNQLKSMAIYLQRSGEHGLDPKMFQAAQINELVNKLYDKKGIKTTDEAYQTVAKLEVMLSNSLINYSNTLQYGVVSPRKIYARYFTETKRPDSASMLRVFTTNNLKTYLDSIQPKSPAYLALQKALKNGVQVPGMTPEEADRTLKVNLERLRWKNKPSQNEYVLVNIPDYRLDVMNDGKSVLNMKVCVGEGRNVDRSNTLVEYDESDKVDRPFSRETPQLNSVIYAVQVNPVWNIPQSIANKEIIKAAQDDPYYLSNKNIDVYKNGKKIEDPETINWADAVDNSAYAFKQRPGDDNALGKIKFLFKNSSSVYLHDTPAKAAFGKNMRAVSHGCVRLEKPLDLAHAIFGDSDKYQTISNDMNADNPDPTNLSTPKKMPVYITYITCWPDEAGTLQFRPDVYGLDVVLFAHLNKYLTA
ncbi:L,D-transpeptidase family protein [Mucilaginibacter robiniae]|uniref:L,D-transpeptidase family protein n=1 Tax=Mucilaginibacter robiniae TaxID=2728022 RepID=A0A7L5DW93_9SPHI|nr:L,D-transpeptidase family protein [Mucilaginibacter robiniae]QJD95021.1 L,D-transpeptidase family protein [Mucilaginibacter robiniae]